MVAPKKPLSDSEAKKYAKQYAKQKLAKEGYNQKEWESLRTLWAKESRWDYKAQNPTSSAYGIPQMLKMAPGTPIEKQIDLGIKYIKSRYDTPSSALKFHLKNGWY